ncbi:hypothetical protein SCACP_34180 [Sporomusa carbonis]
MDQRYQTDPDELVLFCAVAKNKFLYTKTSAKMRSF